MKHPKTLNEFIPSVEQAKLYTREWRNGNGADRQHYLNLETLFSVHPAADRLSQCHELHAAYKCLMLVNHADAANHLATIPNLELRLKNGDPALVKEVSSINGQYQYVFATMFCHHSNPIAYYGFSNPIGEYLKRLNALDGFYGGAINDNALRNYSEYVEIMHSLEKFYHLECLSKLEIDIMLRKASELPL